MTQNIPAASPPTAEQVEALLRGAYNRQYGLEAPWSCPSMTTVLREVLAALAPAERAEVVPDGERCVHCGQTRFGHGGAWCSTFEAPTRIGALDAAGEKRYVRNAVRQAVMKLRRERPGHSANDMTEAVMNAIAAGDRSSA